MLQFVLQPLVLASIDNTITSSSTSYNFLQVDFNIEKFSKSFLINLKCV